MRRFGKPGRFLEALRREITALAISDIITSNVRSFFTTRATYICRWGNVRITRLNGEPGVVLSAAGKPVSVLFLDIEDERVQTIRIVANPSKLDGVVRRTR